MHLAYTPEQDALRQELRDVLRRHRHPRGGRARCRGATWAAPHCLEAVRQMGRDNWLAVSWPAEYGGRNLSLIEQLIFMDEAHRAGAPVPLLTVNTVGQTLLQHGTDEQRQRFLPAILRGRDPLLHRLHRAGVGHRPGVAADQGRPRRRRVGHQRPEGLHLAGRLRHPHLAGRPHRSRRRPSTRGSRSSSSPPTRPASRGSRSTPSRAAETTSTFYERRAGAPRQPDRRAQRRLAPDHQPAQLRAGVDRPAQLGPARLRAGGRVGQGDQAGRRPAGHRPGVGADQPGPLSGPHRVPGAAQLEGGQRRDARPGSGLGHQGLRHRALPREHQGPARHRGPGRRTCGATRPARCWPASSSGRTRPTSS